MSEPISPPPDKRRGIARAAGVIALGNVASRVLGLAREAVISDLFGASGLVSAFRIASNVPMMIYDLLVGGMLSAALVPVFSQVEEREGREALWALFGRVVSLIALLLSAIVLLLELLAPQVAGLMGGGFTPELQLALARMIRIITPAVLFFGLSGAVTALLYALKRFSFTAFAAAVFNLGIVIAAPLLVGHLGAYSLPVGVLLGSFLQLIVQAPGLRGTRLRPRLDFSSPALRRILILYLPIALGVLVSNVQVIVDRRLASGTGEQSVAWMANATTLIQLAHGLVAVAIAQAVLPTLSRQSAAGDLGGFRATLGMGLRLVLVLIVPATLGLLVLGRPVIELFFEHGAFTPADSAQTSWALYGYLAGLIFAAVDWPLNFAFYARQNTITPALVGIWSVAVYLAVALLLVRPLGMMGLVLADSAKHLSHATVMLFLTHRKLGSLGGLGLVAAGGKAVAAAAGMGGLMLAVRQGLAPAAPAGLLGEIVLVGAVAAAGIVAYLGLARLLRVEEVSLLRGLVRRHRQ
ncbi:MAG TPA: murein biosynthesis integral membrane protein MurJ [Anaerolineae bacterium]|nr:murein biosynthesis integral membrane protein MurJ [Anaerolineae bacterium]